jgi:hypothetical protein
VHLVQRRDARQRQFCRGYSSALCSSRKMTESDAANWMLREYEMKRFLYQEEAASHLLHLQDDALAYYDVNGNVCIGKGVLSAFNKLTSFAVYERAGKFWRDRLSTDQPSRQQ